MYDSPGNNSILFYTNPSCSGSDIGSATPPTVGPSTVTFDPGMAIPSGSALNAVVVGSSHVMLVYVDGYTVATSVALIVGQTLQMHGRQLQR